VKNHLVALTGLLALSLIANLVSLDIARNARGRLALVTYTRATARAVPGEVAPPIQAKTLEGLEATIRAQDSPLPTVVYVFSPDCSYCKRNHDSMETAIKDASTRFRFIALSLHRQHLPEYLAKYPTSAQVLMEPSSKAIEAYALGATPTTLVLHPDGMVGNVWLGAFRGTTCLELSRLFGVQLPEVPPLVKDKT